jgi:hypothetical protein
MCILFNHASRNSIPIHPSIVLSSMCIYMVRTVVEERWNFNFTYFAISVGFLCSHSQHIFPLWVIEGRDWRWRLELDESFDGWFAGTLSYIVETNIENKVRRFHWCFKEDIKTILKMRLDGLKWLFLRDIKTLSIFIPVLADMWQWC